MGKVGAGESVLFGFIVDLGTLDTIDAGVMAGATNAWARAVSACNSESSADESMDVEDASEPSELSDDSGGAGVMRVSVTGSATGVLSANDSFWAKEADFCSARDFSVAANDAGVAGDMPVSVASSALGRDALFRSGVCTEGRVACEGIGSSDIFFLRPWLCYLYQRRITGEISKICAIARVRRFMWADDWIRHPFGL